MRIDSDLQPLGPERMISRLQQFLQETSSFSNVLAAAGGTPGLSGNLPSADDHAPFNPAMPGVSISSDNAPPDIKNLIDKVAAENNLDPALLDSLVSVESSYDPTCRSRAGAMGLTQLMPENVREYHVSNPFDPEQNLQAGAKQLSNLIDKYPGRLDLALAAYNAGPGAVAKAGGIPNYDETKNYVKKVLGLYELRRGQP